MKKSLLHIVSSNTRKLFVFLFVVCLLFVANCSLLFVNCFAQWYKQQIPVNKPVTGIKFTDTLNGWACTGKYNNPTPQDTGYILHTTNGGADWQVQYFRKGYEFSTMTMVNNLIGYASIDSIAPFTDWPFLIKTTNGGINWFNIPVAYNMSIDQFYFLSPDTGWEVANAGIGPDVRVTTDGGYNWQVRTNGITSATSCIFFLNYDTGFCGSSNMIFKTSNAGLNWFQIGNFGGTSLIYSMYFLNQDTGFLGLNADTITKIVSTSNGGINWNYRYLTPILDPVKDLFFKDQIGWAGIYYEIIYKTTNLGLNWGYQIDSGLSEHMSFIDSSRGWTGSVGIYKTTNGGGSITYIGIINISNEIPEQYKLFQNFPNPFNPNTRIRFSLIKPSYVRLNIFDVNGKEKVIWNSDKELGAGEHELNFDGSAYASGVYFYQIIVSDLKGKEVFKQTKKMLMIK